MFKKIILLSFIALSLATPTMVHAAPKKPPAAKGCTLYGSKVPNGYQIDFQDRWGNTLHSYICLNGAWVEVLRA